MKTNPLITGLARWLKSQQRKLDMVALAEPTFTDHDIRQWVQFDLKLHRRRWITNDGDSLVAFSARYHYPINAQVRNFIEAEPTLCKQFFVTVDDVQFRAVLDSLGRYWVVYEVEVWP